MRKKLLIAASLFAAACGVYASNITYNWSSVLKLNSNAYDTKPVSSIQSIKLNDDKDLFTMGQFPSQKGTDAASFLGRNDFRGQWYTGSSSNYNFILTKSDKDGKLKWGAYSCYGYFTIGSCSFAPTSDGGAVAAIKVKAQSDYGATSAAGDTVFAIVDGVNDTTVYLADKTQPYGYTHYHFFLVKFDGDGKISKCKAIPVDASPEEKASATYSAHTPDGFDAYNVIIDEDGNYNVVGRMRKDITLDETVVKAHNITGWNGDSQAENGNGFIFKFDPDFKYISHIITGGEITRDNFEKSAYHNGYFYIMGRFTAPASSTLSIGDKSITFSDALRGGFVTKISKDLKNVEYIKLMSTGNEGAFMPQGVSYDEYRDIVYYSGCAQKPITVTTANGDTILNTKNPTAKVHQSFVISADAKTGVFKTGWRPLGTDIEGTTANGTINSAYQVIPRADSIYVTGYKFGGYVYVASLDTNLQTGNIYQAITGGQFPTAFDAVDNDSTLYLAARGRQNDFNFIDGNSTQTYSWDGYKAYSGVLASFNYASMKKQYAVKYIVDGEVVKTDSVEAGTIFTAYTPDDIAGKIFSGWDSEIKTMPHNDIVLNGSFTDAPETAINESENEIVKTYYFTPAGIMTESPLNGVNIRVDVYSDGKSKARKIFNRE